jgi:PAS domain S-box-containing protein
MGQAYIELDYYNQALEYLDEALKKALLSNERLLIRDVYKNLSVAYERMGKFDKAYSNYFLFNAYDDSIQKQNYLSKMEEISNKREIEKSQEQITKAKLALEKKEAELRRRNFVVYSVIAGFVAALVFVVILFRIGRQKQRINTQLMQQNEEVLRSQTIIKKINKALTESEEKLRSIFDVSPYAILVLDAGYKIVDCNDTSLELLRAGTKRELTERSFESLLSPAQDDYKTDNLSEQIRENSLNRKQYLLNRMDDSHFEGEITGRVIRNSMGEIDAFVVVINDITERLHFIESLKEAKLNAEESDRLKTAFLANMSHEIRTPMNSIVGFSNLLNDPKLNPKKRDEFLSHILKSSNLLLSLIDDIIDISKIEAGQLNINLQKFRVNSLVRDTFETFRDANANEEVEYRLVLPRGTETLECHTDPVRLRQILMNLLSNAAKFTQQGFIELGYRLNPQPTRPKLEFYLQDTGIGIENNKQSLIFERFRQIDDSQSRKYGGTGLGLSISKRLVELLSGSIRVESSVGKGSTFYFTIPYILPEEKKKPAPSADKNKYNWKDKKILVAEDENSNYELIKAALTGTKAEVMRARNGEEAVSTVAGGTIPDLVLMDIRMPKMNGYEATRKIKADHPDIPVIAITAYAMSEDESKSLAAGCDMYISKPIRPHKLLEVLEGLLS